MKGILDLLGSPFGGWLVAGGVAALLGWAALERIEVYRLDRERVAAVAERDSARDLAHRNGQAANEWKSLHAVERRNSETLRIARDEASARAADAEEAAALAARAAEREVTVYVQDIARIRMPCGLVRLLDDAADDSGSAGAAGRRAELSASAGCAGKGDRDLAGIGFDALVDGFIWIAEDRRRSKARAAGLSDWFAAHWAETPR